MSAAITTALLDGSGCIEAHGPVHCPFTESFVTRGGVSVLLADPSSATCARCHRRPDGGVELPAPAAAAGARAAVSVYAAAPVGPVVRLRGDAVLGGLPADGGRPQLRIPVPRRMLGRWPCALPTGLFLTARPPPSPPPDPPGGAVTAPGPGTLVGGGGGASPAPTAGTAALYRPLLYAVYAVTLFACWWWDQRRDGRGRECEQRRTADGDSAEEAPALTSQPSAASTMMRSQSPASARRPSSARLRRLSSTAQAWGGVSSLRSLKKGSSSMSTQGHALTGLTPVDSTLSSMSGWGRRRSSASGSGGEVRPHDG
eukprot:gene13745-62946_t